MSADNEHGSNEHIIEFGDYSGSEDEEEPFILDVSFWQSRGCNEAVSQSMIHFQYNLVLQTALLDLLKEYSEGDINAKTEFHSLYRESWPDYAAEDEDEPFLSVTIGLLIEGNHTISGDNIIRCPQWPKFCESLRMCPLKYMGAINFWDVLLTKEMMAMIPETIQLNFEDCEMGQHGLGFVSDHLQGNLCLTKSRIHTTDRTVDIYAAEYFFGTIREHPTLSEISLSHDTSCQPELLPIIMDGVKDVKKVSICWLRGGESTGRQIAKVLATNPKMESFTCGCQNGIDNIGGAEIASALLSNTNLKYLHVSVEDTPDNTESAVGALLYAAYDPSSLNTIIDCNHTCAIEYPGHEECELLESYNRLITDKNWPREKIIKWKLRLALRAGTEQLKIEHFSDVSLKLLPRVLHLMQSDECFSGALSSTFCMMRDTVSYMIASIHDAKVDRKRKRICRGYDTSRDLPTICRE